MHYSRYDLSVWKLKWYWNSGKVLVPACREVFRTKLNIYNESRYLLGSKYVSVFDSKLWLKNHNYYAKFDKYFWM